jgi:tetratricopeptide (TPR) repeat protein
VPDEGGREPRWGAVVIRNNHAEGLHNRSNVLVAQRRYDEALISYAKALAVDPNDVEAHQSRRHAPAWLKL